jgi:hypothetical protein
VLIEDAAAAAVHLFRSSPYPPHRAKILPKISAGRVTPRQIRYLVRAHLWTNPATSQSQRPSTRCSGMGTRNITSLHRENSTSLHSSPPRRHPELPFRERSIPKALCLTHLPWPLMQTGPFPSHRLYAPSRHIHLKTSPPLLSASAQQTGLLLCCLPVSKYPQLPHILR